jgi:hypothetical protein
MEKKDEGGKTELIRAIVEFNKSKYLMKFPADTKVLCIEEYIKRKIKINPT